MYKNHFLILALLSLLTCSFIANAEQVKRIHHVQIDAPTLQSAILPNPKTQPLSIYLPPNYHTSKKHYPVVYYLHGYGGKTTQARVLGGELYTNLLQVRQAKEMIVVGVNGYNQFGGSFYVDSPVTGNWEKFVTQDVIKYIDQNYRTLAEAQHRAIAGYSMGGYGAIHIAFSNPHLFKHLFALSPGLFDKQGLDEATKQWQAEGWKVFMQGYAAAFAPNPTAEGPNKWHAWNENSPIVKQKWANGFGNVEQKVKRYINQPQQLNTIHIEYGSKDKFQWIATGSAYLINSLKTHKVEFTYHDHLGGHELGKKQATKMILHFAAVL